MNSEIERLHPYTIIMYVVAVVLVETLTMNIFIIAEACIGAFIVGIVLMGPKRPFRISFLKSCYHSLQYLYSLYSQGRELASSSISMTIRSAQRPIYMA